MSGNDQHLEPAAGLVQITGQAARKDLVLPSGDTLFTSGTLGHYSAMLLDLQQNESRRLPVLNQTAAD
jgi:NADH-quinone oxidoreductase subunit G